MKKTLMLVGFLVFSIAHADNLKSLLEVKEHPINPLYYQILPKADDKNPDITFIRSREPKTMSLEDDYLQMLDDAFNATRFIETGTYHGDTTAKATRFFEVDTIELSKELFEKAKKRFAKQKKIRTHHGDSAQVLPTLLKSRADKTIIFLDAHFSMHDTAKGSENTPLITELEMIKHSGITDAILIIDDIRMFDTHSTSMKGTFAEGYPTLNEIVHKILTINATYQCAVVYDTLLAFPAEENITVSPTVKAVTMSRLYDGGNYAIEDLILAELCISHAKNAEKAALVDLGEHWVEPWSQQAGLSRHYALWTGLILLEHEEWNTAHAYVSEAKKRGIRDWRIDWYLAMAEAQCFFDIR
jgi:hypothetical protein